MTEGDLIGGKTLQEIQDMPMSEMRAHMRKHSDPHWGRSDNGKNRAFNVEVRLITEEYIEVVARNFDEAAEEAERYIKSECSCDDYEISNVQDVESGEYNG